MAAAAAIAAGSQYQSPQQLHPSHLQSKTQNRHRSSRSAHFALPLTSSFSLRGLYPCSIPAHRKIGLYPVIAQSQPTEEILKVMISGAPASGKGTQCEFIVQKYGLLHISTGDLLRAEVAAGTENGLKAKSYMTSGQLVPDDIVIQMVKEKLATAAVQGQGWLLDGFPRTALQANALEILGIRPDIFIVLEVPDEVLIERVVGRRLDPVSGKIYHLKYSPPENEEVAARLIQRSDDTEEKAKVRLQNYAQNVEAITSTYENIMKKIDGNRLKDIVFEEIDKNLAELLKKSEYVDSPQGFYSKT